MERELYDNLMTKIKVFEKTVVNIPDVGKQTKHKLFHIVDDTEKFTLIINKGGHRNPHNLTIILNSNNYKSNMIRFDVNGSDHANPPNYERIPTPHIHIITDEYDNGGIAIPLKEIEDIELIDELFDSLEFFMDYTNIKRENVIIEPNLF